MPKIVIDGSEIEVEQGANLIAAAELAGIRIPHFCYHPALSVVAQCRQCLVEVKGVPKVMPACNTFATDGMEVVTNSEKAVSARRATVEFTLINHPLDCPVCDKGGECPLQMTAVSHGRDYSRFDPPEEKKVRKKYYLGEKIVYDPNRCIMCTRCVRFTDEVTGTGELGYDNRGFRKKITVFPGMELNNELSGNVIDLCPVGALLPADSLHGERVWYLKHTDTVCPLCSNGCNITVGANLREGGIMRVRPRFNSEVNGHWICDRGRFEFDEDSRAPAKRLKQPIRKTEEGGYETVSWDAAAETFRAAHRSRSAIVCSASLTNEELYLVLKMSEEFGFSRLACNAGEPGAGGGEKKFGLISPDPFPNSAGARDLGIASGAAAVGEVVSGLLSGELDSLFVIQTDLTAFGDAAEVGRALENLSFLAVLDTRLTATGRLAGLLLPGTTPYEKDGTFTNDRGRVQRIRKAIDPPGEAKPEWEALKLLCASKPEQFFHNSPAEIMGEISARFKPYEAMDYDLIDFLGVGRRGDVSGQPSV